MGGRAGVKRAVSIFLFLSSTLSMVGCNSAEDRARAHYERGLELVDAGEPVKAGLEFRNAIKLDETFTDALFQLGLVEERQSHFDSAARIYLSVSEREPEHLDSRVHLAYILLASGQLDDAIEQADQALAIDDDYPAAMVAKASAELRLNNRGEAVRLARAALAKVPSYIDAYMVLASERILAADLPAALALLDQTSANGEQNIGLQMLRLSILNGMDNQPEVEALLKKLSRLFPETPAFSLSLVQWYIGKGRDADAEAAARQFAAERPNDDGAQQNLISFLVERRGSAPAIAEARKIVAAREASGGSAYNIRMSIAELQFEAGDKAGAIELVRAVIAKEADAPKRNAARIQLARMLADDGNLQAAEALANAVLEDDAKNVDALRVRASVELADGELEKAIDDLLAAANEAPSDVQVYSMLASAYERRGEVVSASEQYAKAMELGQSSPATGLPFAEFLIRYGRSDQALNVLERVRTASPHDRQVLTLLAQLKLNKRDWVGAQQIAETLSLLDSDKTDTTADRIMAATLVGEDKLDESISLLQASLSSDSSAPGMLSDLVGNYIRAGRLADAEKLLKDTLAADASNVEAHILLGSVYSLSGRQDLARQAFVSASDADKKGALGAAALAQFYLSTGDADQAEITTLKALNRDGNNPVLLSLLGSIYQKQERFEHAITQYELLFQLSPESTATANDLASLLSERRATPDALEQAYEIAQRFQTSQVPQYLDTLGWIYYLRGDYPAALPLLKSAAEGLPMVSLVQFHLGMTLMRLGQQAQAITKLNQAVAMSPPLISADLDKARQALQELQREVSAADAAAGKVGSSK